MHARPATPADAPEVVRLGALMFDAMGIASGGEWQRGALDVVREGLADGTLVAFVVDRPDGTGVVANAAAVIGRRLPGPTNTTGRTAYVQYVCTEEAWRGKGFGRAVMEALLAACDRLGVGLVELHATADGEALYRSPGFTDPPNPNLRRRP